MQHKNHFLLLAFALLALILPEACSTDATEAVPISAIDVNQKSKASSMFSEYSFIPLETTEDNIMSTIQDIDLDEHTICAHCRSVIYIFDRNGKYLSKIDRKGQGPEEYIGITDFCLQKVKYGFYHGRTKLCMSMRQTVVL